MSALVRAPEAFTIEHERLTVTQGDARDRQAVAAVVQGADAVISTIGLKKGADTSLSEATTTICGEMDTSRVRRSS